MYRLLPLPFDPSPNLWSLLAVASRSFLGPPVVRQLRQAIYFHAQPRQPVSLNSSLTFRCIEVLDFLLIVFCFFNSVIARIMGQVGYRNHEMSISLY